VLEFAGESWTEVHDAQGRRLVYDLVAGGTTRVADGEAPFRVLLGNASAVTVQIDGRAYDHSGYIRGNVARFAIGGPSGTP
jgi:cytoskeleton protein RodZ